MVPQMLGNSWHIPSDGGTFHASCGIVYVCSISIVRSERATAFWWWFSTLRIYMRWSAKEIIVLEETAMNDEGK
jgi:hypothetical protein